MKYIVIYEPYATGHRMVYVQYILQAIKKQGGLHTILVTDRDAADSPIVVQLLQTFPTILSIHKIHMPTLAWKFNFLFPPRLKRQICHLKQLKACLSFLSTKVPIKYVFIPFLDDYCHFPLAFNNYPFGIIPWSGIVIRPRFHLRSMGAILPKRWEEIVERFIYWKLLRNKSLERIFCIDPYFVKFFNENPKVKSIPDPSGLLTTTPDRSFFDYADDIVVLLVYGYIDHRKAIDRLLVVMNDERMPRNLQLILLGRQDVEIAKSLSSEYAQTLRKQGRLVEISRHITEQEEVAAFNRADIVWVYYPGSYCSSGALVRAGQSASPVISTREGLVGMTVSAFRMGLTAGEYDDVELTDALIRLAGDRHLRKELGDAGYKYFSSATKEAFGDLIASQIYKSVSLTTETSQP